MTAPNDKRSLPYGGSFAIQDLDVLKYMSSLSLIPALYENDITRKFCKKYIEWILSTKNNSVNGLLDFQYSVFSNGTSQSFDMFYIKNKNRRFRCFRGEYIYHQLAWRNNWPDWLFVDQAPLTNNDALVISLPFSDTGNEHPEMRQILSICNDLKIPVLIDCAYFGICSNINFDFTDSCITDIVFGLSKTFPVAHARIGMRLTKVDDDDLMFVYDKINYNNRLSAKLGLDLFSQYSPDYIYNKYFANQQSMCSQLNVDPSNTVIFGIDRQEQYPEYNRGNVTNRLSFHNHLNV